jgi:hypothetical protein
VLAMAHLVNRLAQVVEETSQALQNILEVGNKNKVSLGCAATRV